MSEEAQLKLEGREGSYRKICWECSLVVTGTGAEHYKRTGHHPVIWHDNQMWKYRKASDTFIATEEAMEVNR